MLLAEAGTGIGKTLAYLSPASLWAEASGGTVWVSTFTKALQRQLDAEGPRLFADPDERARRIVVRKGRENYLCLLNLEDALQGAFSGRAAILAQLVGRWAAYSKDGDMVGGDLPGWLPSLFRRAGATALTDRRGECVYAGCPHYRRCFIERAERAGREADIVIANHALVMINAARAREDAPQRIVFDEGHHLFDAADSTFAVTFGGQDAIEMRRWIVGPEGKSRGRRRGLGGTADGRRLLRRRRRVRRWKRLSRRRGRFHPTDGCSGSSKVRRSGRSRPCSPKCAAWSTRGPRRRTRVTGWRPSLPSPTVRWWPRPLKARRDAGAPAEAARCAAAVGWRQCSKMRRTGSTPRRERASREQSTASPGGAKSSRHGSRCSRASAVRRIPSSSTGSRSIAPRAASMTWRSIVTGSIRPSPSREPCSGRRMACSSLPQPCAAATASGRERRRGPAPCTSTATSADSKRKARSTMRPVRKC